MTQSPRRPADDGDGGFEAFFHANNTGLRRYLRLLVGHDDVDDVLQLTWMSLADFWDKYGPPRSDEHARALMFQTGKRRAIDHWRTTSRRPAALAWDPDEHDQVDPHSIDPFDAVIEQQSKSGMRAALTHRQQTALRLVYVDEFDQQAAAAVMGISTSALERLLARARDRIAQTCRAAETSTEEGSR